ncbi:MAG: hypothetical protein AAF830_00885 [Pseudomonadota bacterium]
MIKWMLTASAVAVISGSIASASTVITQIAVQTGTVTNQNLFGGKSGSSFSDSFRIGIDEANIYASAQASTGTVSSIVATNFTAQYLSDFILSSADTVEVTLLGSAGAAFDTSFGAGFEAGVSTSLLGIGDIPLIDRGYALNARANNASLSRNGTGTDSQAFARVGIPEFPGITISGGVSGNATQSSTLDLRSLMGTLEARNTTTGTLRTQNFSFSSVGAEDFFFDLSEVGTWELTLADVRVDNRFTSVFGVSVSGDAGFALGLNCGDPSTDRDNGGLCIFDAGVEVSSEPLDLANIPGFELLYTGLANRSLGSILVNADPSPVPVPGALPLMLSILGGGALFRMKQKA